MVYVETLVRIVDNSGGFYAKCIRILTNSKYGLPGNEVVIAVKSILLNTKVTHRVKRKVLKGTVRRALIIRSTKLKRWGNVNFKLFSTPAVALVGRWEMPIGNRITGPSFFEARETKFVRVAMLSENII